MFNDRYEHQGFVLLAAGLCIVGAILITFSLFQMHLSAEAGYSPIVVSCTGAGFFLAGIGVGGYVRYRMTR